MNVFKQAQVMHTPNGDYVPFQVEDYVDNPVALARIKARVSQSELSRRLE